jgi:uncharacterized protein YkwD
MLRKNNLLLASSLIAYSRAAQLSDGVVDPPNDEVVIAVPADDGGLAQITTTEEGNYEIHMFAQQNGAVDDEQKDVDIWAVQNQIRTDPTSVIPALYRILDNFESNDIYYVDPNTGTRWRTNEGSDAVIECIEFLENVDPVHALEWSDALTDAAEYHTVTQGQAGETGHNSPAGYTMRQRIDYFAQQNGAQGWESTIGENISYGSPGAMDVMLALMIDDGVPNRGHRVNIFKEEFRTVGIFTGYHDGYRTMTTLDYAYGIRNEDTYRPREPNYDWEGADSAHDDATAGESDDDAT